MDAGCADTVKGSHGKHILVTAGQDFFGQRHLVLHEPVFHGHPGNQPVIIIRGMDCAKHWNQVLIHDLAYIRIRIVEKVKMGLDACFPVFLFLREMKGKAGRNPV